NSGAPEANWDATRKLRPLRTAGRLATVPHPRRSGDTPMTARSSAAALAAAALLAAPAPASDALRNEVRTALAEPLKKLPAGQNQAAIAVGEFTGPAQLDTNAGPGLQQLLADELKALGVAVDKTAPLSVKGRYALVDDKDRPGQVVVKVTAEVFDRNDERKSEFNALLPGV